MRPALLVGLSMLACTSKPSSSPPMKDVAVIVNGHPISEFEIQLRRRDRGAGEPLSARDAALEQVVKLELEAQRAEQLGLDKDPRFNADMERIAAQFRDARRRELARAFRLKEVVEKAKPTEEEVKAYFTTYARRIRTEYHVEQLFTTSQATAEEDRAAILAGKAFEEVAMARAKAVLKTLPEGLTPYEMPAMTFDLVPTQWWPQLDLLEPGKVSGVIPMPKGRFVLIRLLETRELPEVTLEAVRPRLEALLKAKAIEDRQAELEATLRKNATVELAAPPAGSDD